MVTDASAPAASIRWRGVLGITLLQAAITLDWMAYGASQPRILARYSLGAMVPTLLFAQAAIAAVLEPTMGGLFDRLRRRHASSFLVIGVGVTIAGIVFAAIAMLLRAPAPAGGSMTSDVAVARGSGDEGWVLLVLMLLWVAAMNTFRSPAMAYLGECATTGDLSRAAGVMMLVTGVVSATGPVIGRWIDHIGASTTFAFGGLALVAGTVAFRVLLADVMREAERRGTPLASGDRRPGAAKDRGWIVSLLFFIGGGTGLASSVLLRLLPTAFRPLVGDVSPSLIQAAMLLVVAFLSLPAGLFAVRSGPAVGVGIGVVLLLAPGAVFLVAGGAPAAVACGVLVAAGLALIASNGVPYALSLLPAAHSGLASGAYLGGGAAAFGIASAGARGIGAWGAGIGAIASLAAMVVVARIRPVVTA